MQRDSWIIDGNFVGTLELRLSGADTVIYLDFPARVCLWRVLNRVFKYAGTVRPDMAPGCPERFDWEFLKWIWRFRRDTRPKIMRLLEERGGSRTVRIFYSQSEVDRFIREISPGGRSS